MNYYCSNCQILLSIKFPPLELECNHLCCYICLQHFKVKNQKYICRICGQENNKNIEQLAQRNDLIPQNQESERVQSDYFQQCGIHQKQIEMTCLVHSKQICVKCLIEEHQECGKYILNEDYEEINNESSYYQESQDLKGQDLSQKNIKIKQKLEQLEEENKQLKEIIKQIGKQGKEANSLQNQSQQLESEQGLKERSEEQQEKNTQILKKSILVYNDIRYSQENVSQELQLSEKYFKNNILQVIYIKENDRRYLKFYYQENFSFQYFLSLYFFPGSYKV